PLPGRVGQCAGRARATDCPGGRLLREDRPPDPAALHHAGRSRPRPRLFAPPSATSPSVRWRAGRAGAGALAPQPTRVRQAEQPVDLGVGRRGQLHQGREPDPRQRRDDPPDAQTPGGGLQARPAVDHQPRTRVSAKKRQRDRLISLTEQHTDWALGFLDATWWSRLARPALHTWADASQPLRLVEPAVASSDPDPKALAG